MIIVMLLFMWFNDGTQMLVKKEFNSFENCELFVNITVDSVNGLKDYNYECLKKDEDYIKL